MIRNFDETEVSRYWVGKVREWLIFPLALVWTVVTIWHTIAQSSLSAYLGGCLMLAIGLALLIAVPIGRRMSRRSECLVRYFNHERVFWLKTQAHNRTMLGEYQRALDAAKSNLEKIRDPQAQKEALIKDHQATIERIQNRTQALSRADRKFVEKTIDRLNNEFLDRLRELGLAKVSKGDIAWREYWLQQIASLERVVQSYTEMLGEAETNVYRLDALLKRIGQ